jgi:hypothetical protein
MLHLRLNSLSVIITGSMSEVILVNCGFPSVVIEEASTYQVIVWNKAIFNSLILRIALLCGSWLWLS